MATSIRVAVDLQSGANYFPLIEILFHRSNITPSVAGLEICMTKEHTSVSLSLVD